MRIEKVEGIWNDKTSYKKGGIESIQLGKDHKVQIKKEIFSYSNKIDSEDFINIIKGFSRNFDSTIVDFNGELEWEHGDPYANISISLIGTRNPTKEEMDLFNELKSEYRSQCIKDGKLQREKQKLKEQEEYERLKAKYEKLKTKYEK